MNSCVCPTGHPMNPAAIERRDTTLDDMDAVYITDGITRMIILLDPAR